MGRSGRTAFACEGLEPRTLLAAIISNTTTPGNIGANGELDAYEFQATAGDQIVLSVGEGAGAAATFEPMLVLNGPDGTLVAQNFPATGGRSALIIVAAPTTGAYAVTVKERDNTATGDYLLHFARLPHANVAPDPADNQGGPLTSGHTYAAAIATPGDFDLYSVNAASGDTLVVSVGEGGDAAAGFEPMVQAFGPDGALAAQNFGATGANSALVTHRAAAAGVYNVVVRDRDNADTSSYLLHFAKAPDGSTAPDPGDNQGGGLVSNTTVNAAIATPGDIDLYSVNAAAGDTLVLSMGEAANAQAAFEPRILVYGPDGALVADKFGATGSNNAFVTVRAAAAGVYNAIVLDRDFSATSDYRLHFVKAPQELAGPDPADNQGGPLTSGRTYAAAIATPGDVDFYSVRVASPGESLVISVGEGADAEAAFEPRILLYGPDGALVADEFGATGANSAISTVRAAAAGVYTAVVLDRDSSATSSYLLHFAKVPDGNGNPDPGDNQGGALVSNTTVGAAIGTPGDIDLYSVTAAAGDTLLLSMGEADSAPAAFEPRILLYGPDGALVADRFGATGANSAIVTYRADAAGVYNAVVLDRDSSATSDYRLHFSRLPHANVSPDPADGEGGTLVSNNTYGAHIGTVGDVDTYGVSATAGERLIISVGEGAAANVNFEPYVALYGPDGALVAQNFGATGANSAFIELAAPATGAYNVVVYDRDDSATADYRLHFLRLPNAGPATDPADNEGKVLARNSTTDAAIGTVGDLDLYTIQVVGGEEMVLDLDETPVNATFEPYISLYGPDGALIRQNFGATGATSATIDFTTTASGTYYVVVRDRDNTSASPYTLTYFPKATVLGRRLFYNNSFWDTPTLTNPLFNDDTAIAPDKNGLLPRQGSGAASMSGYTKGINGVMVDIAALPGDTLPASELSFKVGTTNNPATWADAPAPSSVVVRKGAGVDGSDRVVITWPDGSILNQWLQVRLASSLNTDLTGPDVFYFGSLVGETGSSPGTVNAIDLSQIRARQLQATTVGSPQDINRDGRINAVDLGITRANQLHTLVSFTPPAPTSTLASPSLWAGLAQKRSLLDVL